jgi:hypothetical protein
MVVEAETGSDKHAKYKANVHACRRLWALQKMQTAVDTKYGRAEILLGEDLLRKTVQQEFRAQVVSYKFANAIQQILRFALMRRSSTFLT